MESLKKIFDFVEAKLEYIENVENYDSEPGPTSSWYIRQLREIRSVVETEMKEFSKKEGDA